MRTNLADEVKTAFLSHEGDRRKIELLTSYFLVSTYVYAHGTFVVCMHVHS